MSYRLAAVALCLHSIVPGAQQPKGQPGNLAPTFYEDVLPIVQKRCISCHSPGGVASTSFLAFSDVQPHAAAIQEAVKSRRMPPWIAESGSGEFSNDPRLTEEEIRLIDAWAASGALPGKRPKQRRGAVTEDPEESSADLMMTAPRPVSVAPNQVQYAYMAFSLAFTYDRWVRAAEIRPSERGVVHHAALYIRERGARWMRDLAPGMPSVSAAPAAAPEKTDRGVEILAIYTPGGSATVFPQGAAKRIPAGADLVLELHYNGRNTPASDHAQLGLAFITDPPKMRMLTVQMGPDGPSLPGVSGTLSADALLTAVYPHLMQRGVALAFEIVGPDGRVDTLLKSKPSSYDWYSSYVLRTPRLVPKGSTLRWKAIAGSTTTGLMTGFFDVAVDPGAEKQILATQ